MGEYNGAAVGAFETDSYLVACVAVDAAVKAAERWKVWNATVLAAAPV